MTGASGGPRRTLSEAERQAAFAELRAELDVIGAGAIGLRLTADPADEAMGRYARGVIEVALAEPGMMRSVLRHEIVHALRDLGAISEDEWEILAARARDDWIDAFGIRERYAGEPEEIVIEEAVAEAWRRWSESRLDAEERTSWLFARIARLIETIREAFRGRGARTVEDVFQAINRGERPVDPARTGSARQADDEPGLPEVDWSSGVLQGAEKRPWLLDKDAVPQVEIGRLFPHLSRNDAQRAMLQWGRNNIQNFNIGQKSYFNRDTQWNVVIERQGLKHGIMYTGRARHNFELAPALPELLENAVRFETEGVRRSEQKRNRGVVAVHHFAASARLDGQQLWVRLTVKEKREGTSYTKPTIK